VCVLLEFWQKTWAIPIMNPLSWFMIITSGIPDHYSIGIPDHYSMSEKKNSPAMLRSSSSPEDEGACNYTHSQRKRQNSNMADISQHSIFLLW